MQSSWMFVSAKENLKSFYRGRFWKYAIARLLILVWKASCTCLKTHLQVETYHLRKKTLHMCACRGSLLVQSCSAVAHYISVYIIKRKNKNNCHPESNVALENMSETNHFPEISRMPQAQNCKTFFLRLPTSETGCMLWCHQSADINQGMLWEGELRIL